MSERDDTSTRSWNAIADDWVSHADSNDYRNHYLRPRMLTMVGDVRGKAILDLGCGEGGYSRELSRRGARVTAVDGSERLIEVAQRRARQEHVNMTFFVANANALDMVEANSTDLVVAAMSLMDVEDYPGAIREVARVLRPLGELVMCITHPCFSSPGSKWVRTETGELEFFAVDRYFDRRPWEEFITARFHSKVLRRHRPLEDFIVPALAAGLTLRDFVEPGVTGDELRLSERFRKLARVPYFLFLRWAKL